MAAAEWENTVMRHERPLRSGRTRRIEAALSELRRLAAARKPETAAGRGTRGGGRPATRRTTTVSRP